MSGHCLFDTALGTCAIAWTDRGVRAFALPDTSPAATVHRIAKATGTEYRDPPREIGRVIERVTHHLAGELEDFSDIRLDLNGLPGFARDVYHAARDIGPGHVVTYGELARRVGKPRSARAVGQALGKNPIALIVPCHRVVARNGKLGGFSASGGIDTKRRLLAIELPPTLFAAPEPMSAVA
jgi:methylated-DNA-[protein]-cysteine S-methyltransferase